MCGVYWFCTADIDYLPEDNMALAALRRHALLWADALTRLLLHRHSLPLVAYQMVCVCVCVRVCEYELTSMRASESTPLSRPLIFPQYPPPCVLPYPSHLSGRGIGA